MNPHERAREVLYPLLCVCWRGDPGAGIHVDHLVTAVLQFQRQQDADLYGSSPSTSDSVMAELTEDLEILANQHLIRLDGNKIKGGSSIPTVTATSRLHTFYQLIDLAFEVSSKPQPIHATL